jgi:phosphoribosylanthranilate isomerase
MIPRRTRIKVCGVVRPEDALLAAELGADAVGVNFHPQSSRFVTPAQARAIAAAMPFGVDLVGVFVDMDAPTIRKTAWEVGFSTIQLHGDELAHQVFRLAPFRVVKAFRWKSPETTTEIAAYVRSLLSYHDEGTGKGTTLGAVLIDAHREGHFGGTGAAWNWSEGASVNWPAPLIIAGGLNPDNVGGAIRNLQPFAVDVAGGVESALGVKDPDKLRAFIDAVRLADAETKSPPPAAGEGGELASRVGG